MNEKPITSMTAGTGFRTLLHLWISLLILGCNKQDQYVKPTKHLETIATSNSGVEYHEVFGSVIAQTYNDSIVIVRFQHRDTDTTSAIFVFQTDGALRNQFNAKIPDARLIYSNHALYLKSMNNNGQEYRFVINDEHSKESGAKLENDLSIKVKGRFYGVGLAKLNGRWVNLPSSLHSSSALESNLYKTLQGYKVVRERKTSNQKDGLPTTNAIPYEDYAGCTAGGRGSTSCSYHLAGGTIEQSCDVTCRSGYYACCGNGSCRCIRE